MCIYVKFRLLGVLAVVLFILGACRLNEDKMWDVDLLTPIAQAELDINDLLQDSGLVKNADETITYIQRISLSALDVTDILKVPDTTLENTVNLKTLQIGERSMQRNITLGEVARNAGFTGQLILASHGQEMAIPPLNDLSTGDIAIDANSFFESATFIDGKLEIKLTNGFPIELNDIRFELKNKSDDVKIVQDTILSIMPDETVTRTYPLANKNVDGNLIAKIISMRTPGSGTNKVLVDTTDALQIRLRVYDMQVLTAKAIFPAQNVVNDRVNIGYYMNGAEIKFMRVKTGDIKITTVHTIQENMVMRYAIPGAIRNGSPFDISRQVPAAPPGDSSRQSEIYSIAGYDVDLTGEFNDTVNTFFNILTVRIDSSGKLQQLSLKDSLYIYYGLYNVTPSYARGYLGQTKYIVGPENISASAFPKVIGGNISINDLTVNLDITNGIGAPATVKIEYLKAINSKSGKSVPIHGPALETEIQVNPAADDPFTQSITSFMLNRSNSNILEALEILPDRFEYKIEVNLNPNGNTNNYEDFIYDNSTVSADLNIEMPMHLSFNGLTLQDTVELEQNSTLQNGIKNARLYINTENGFPLDADVQVYVMNSFGQITDSLFKDQTIIRSGVLNSTTKRVTQPTITRNMIDVNEATWQRMGEGGKLIIRTKLQTQPTGEKLKIYSDYRLKVSITADVKYRSSI